MREIDAARSDHGVRIKIRIKFRSERISFLEKVCLTQLVISA